MNPQDIEAFLQYGAENEDLEAEIALQKAQAERLRGMGKMPGMRDTGRGFMVAAHPLEALGALANQGLGMHAESQALAGQKKIGANRLGQNKIAARSLMNAPQPTDPAGPGLMPPRPQSPFSFGGDY